MTNLEINYWISIRRMKLKCKTTSLTRLRNGICLHYKWSSKIIVLAGLQQRQRQTSIKHVNVRAWWWHVPSSGCRDTYVTCNIKRLSKAISVHTQWNKQNRQKKKRTEKSFHSSPLRQDPAFISWYPLMLLYGNGSRVVTKTTPNVISIQISSVDGRRHISVRIMATEPGVLNPTHTPLHNNVECKDSPA